MQQIADWLEKLGMSEYAQRFGENDIDIEVLSELTDTDFDRLGVSIGHRRKLMKALAAGVPTAAAASPSFAIATSLAPEQSRTAEAARPISPSMEVAAGERRYLTVLFCDLVGSTGISAQLDAEDWRDLVGGYLDAATTAVTEMGGHIAKKLGDGVMALFGYPVAQENDAERSARAALSIQRALAQLNRTNANVGKSALNARIGIAPTTFPW